MGAVMSQPATVWIALKHLGYDGDILIGVAAAPDLAKQMCAGWITDEAIGGWVFAEDGWTAQVPGSDSQRYTVTEHVVQGDGHEAILDQPLVSPPVPHAGQ
jgi:hypothetical protein